MINDSFKEMTARSFGAEVSPLTTASAINEWCSDKTHGKIPEIMQQIPDRAVMILVNAVYFSGKWTIPFEKERTSEENFSRSNGSTMRVPMMFQKRKNFRYYEQQDRFQMVQVLYCIIRMAPSHHISFLAPVGLWRRRCLLCDCGAAASLGKVRRAHRRSGCR